MKPLLLDCAQYNEWANTRFITLFRGVDEALINQHIVSSFPSIRETLLHIWDVEMLWLERLKGNSPTTFPSKSFTGSNNDIYDGLLQASDNLKTYIEKCPKIEFTREIAFKTIKIGEFSDIKANMMQTTLNHSTFHRGQLVVMCRQLNIGPIPQTDFIAYKRLSRIK